jgi:hypothetical protein
MHWRFSKVIGRNLWLLIFVKRRGCHYIQLKVTVEPDRIFLFNLKVWLTLLLVQRGFIVTSPCMHKMHLDDIHLLCDSPHYTQTHFLQFSSVSLFYFHSADRVLWFFFGMDGWLWWQALLLVKGIFKAQDITGSFSALPFVTFYGMRWPGVVQQADKLQQWLFLLFTWLSDLFQPNTQQFSSAQFSASLT